MFLRDRLSYLHLLVILKFFSRFSGLSVNDDKTELFAIGPQKLQEEEFYFIESHSCPSKNGTI